MGRDTASSNNSSIELLEGTAAWGAYVLILEANRRNIYLKVDIQIWVLTLMRAEILSWREKLLAAEVEKVKFSSWQVCKLKEWQKIQFTLGWKLGKSSLVLKVQGINKKKRKKPHTNLRESLKLVTLAGCLPALAASPVPSLTGGLYIPPQPQLLPIPLLQGCCSGHRAIQPHSFSRAPYPYPGLRY